MVVSSKEEGFWANRRIGITGAKGALGKALTKTLRAKGAVIIGLTHGKKPKVSGSTEEPQEWVQWECGAESSLERTLSKLDILIINHGVNPKGNQSTKDFELALEVNALSSWRLLKLFRSMTEVNQNKNLPREIWINTSEAEIQPALSPTYEISKRLIGQLVTHSWSNISENERKDLKIRKLVLGPFRSELNPIGLMTANWVANQIIMQAEFGISLIIVTPNPITYFIMPITEISRILYDKIIKKLFT